MNNTRIENVLKRSKADAILVSDPTAIYYLIGKRIYPGERFLALVLRRDQKPVLFLNNLFPFEEDEQVKVVRYNDGDNVSDLLCPYIGKDEVLGVDKMLVARFLLPMQQAKLAKEFIDGSIAVDKTRAVKDEHEKELMRKSSAINDAAMERFKKLHDLEEEPYVIPLVREVSKDLIDGFVGQEAAAHNQRPVNMGLVRNDEGEFETTPASQGVRINEEASKEAIYKYLTETWTGGEPRCSMEMEILEPKGTEEELAKVKDVLGEGSTDFSSSSSSRAKNVINGTNKINGSVVYPGEEFSVLDHLVPFNEENGYDPAPSYNEGRTEDSFGGGICQVSTTLYLAVLRSELEVVERHCHSMTVSYVKPSMDAAIASGSKDFVFKNNTDAPIYIYANADDRTVTMRIYGMETRDEGHKVSFESEVYEKKDPEGIKLTANTHYGFGHIKYVQGARPDIRARLWKIVTENGEEVSREEINTSHYEMVKETYEIGVVSGSETATSEMFHAVDHNDLNEVNRVINKYGTYSTGYSDD